MAGNPQDWQDKTIPTTFQQNTAVSDPSFVKSFQNWGLSNPHPGYGKDPNILNEYGHTVYPKMIYPHGKEQQGVLVQSEEEEKELLNPSSVPQSNGSTDSWS